MRTDHFKRWTGKAYVPSFVYDLETGEKLFRWPVDCRELVATQPDRYSFSPPAGVKPTGDEGGPIEDDGSPKAPRSAKAKAAKSKPPAKAAKSKTTKPKPPPDPDPDDFDQE